MKKVFAICTIALVFAACNNEADTTDATADSIRRADSLRREDSISAAAAAAMDTMNKSTDSLMMSDSLKK